MASLERRTSVEVAVRLAAQVSGVVEVINNLTFDFDDTLLAGLGLVGEQLPRIC